MNWFFMVTAYRFHFPVLCMIFFCLKKMGGLADSGILLALLCDLSLKTLCLGPRSKSMGCVPEGWHSGEREARGH